MFLVWQKSFPDPSRFEAQVCFDRGAFPPKERVVIAHEIAAEDRGKDLKHLAAMMAYGLPTYITGEVVDVAATKTIDVRPGPLKPPPELIV